MNGLKNLDNLRFIWFLLFIFMFLLVLFSHYFFQIYLFMQPCEYCVYIRFVMLLVSFSSLIIFIYPNKVTKFIFFSFIFYAIFMGFYYSYILNSIHIAVHSDDLFSNSINCFKNPKFPFGLKLDNILPSFFKPEGICGIDNPYVLESSNLSKIQEFFVGTKANSYNDGFYSNGWYLIPSLKFINMAKACFIIFFVYFLVVLIMFISFLINFKTTKSFFYGIIIIAFSFILVFIGNITRY